VLLEVSVEMQLSVQLEMFGTVGNVGRVVFGTVGNVVTQGLSLLLKPSLLLTPSVLFTPSVLLTPMEMWYTRDCRYKWDFRCC
jgi:hypothetical protein